MRGQGIPADLYQQIFFPFLLLLFGEDLTFLNLRQIMTDEKELLFSSGVVCRSCFVERPLLVSVIVNPLTEVIPNVKAPGRIELAFSPRAAGMWR